MSKFEFHSIVDIVKQLDLGEDAVVIGGQALSFLCLTFVEPADLQSLGSLASKDLDFQSTRDIVERCARRVNVQLETPRVDTKTELIGVFRFKVNDDECRVDFLTTPLGLPADEVNRFKLKFDVGSTSIYVMHPLHCLQSRATNVAQLPTQYANPNGLGQLKAAIVMVRAFILKEAELDAEQAAKMCERVHSFCFEETALEVYRDHQIDIFEAIPRDVLPEKVLTLGYPNWVRQLQERRDKFVKAPKRIH